MNEYKTKSVQEKVWGVKSRGKKWCTLAGVLSLWSYHMGIIPPASDDDITGKGPAEPEFHWRINAQEFLSQAHHREMLSLAYAKGPDSQKESRSSA